MDENFGDGGFGDWWVGEISLCGGWDGTTLDAGGTFRHRERLRMMSDDGRSLEGGGIFVCGAGCEMLNARFGIPSCPVCWPVRIVRMIPRSEENRLELR